MTQHPKTYNIAIGSTNAIKVEAARAGLERLIGEPHSFRLDAFDVDSNVNGQPYGESETRRGAISRAVGAMRPGYDFAIGLESGVIVEKLDNVVTGQDIKTNGNNTDQYYSFGRVAIIDRNYDPDMPFISEGRTPSLRIPPGIVELLKQGYELGEANDIYWREQDTKRGEGMAGKLTNSQLTRTGQYIDSIVATFVPFYNAELYDHTRVYDRRSASREDASLDYARPKRVSQSDK